MGLFYRRPLCLFCALFIATSVILGYAKYKYSIGVLAAMALAALIFALLFLLVKKRQAVFMFCLLCACAVLLSVLCGSLRMAYREKQAEALIGKREVEVSVTDVEYSSDYTSVYTVRIDKVNGEATHIKAQLVCAFKCDFKVGDCVAANVQLKDISESTEGNTDADTQLLIMLNEPDGASVLRFDYTLPLWRAIFERNGLSVVIYSARSFICERLDTLLGKDFSGLAKGFLLGERSGISTEEIRDFRRTGLSHIFAVSGMHIAVLLGGLNYILRKLFLHRYARMAVVAAASLPMLALTGFALSAWRSVLMLWIAYICFVLSEDTDMPTSLFISIALIILVSPNAVYDIGMWLSFFATLGLVTVYPMLEAKLPYPQKGIMKIPLKIARAALLIFIMTLVCNVFILPLQWYIFGELSVMSVIANIPLSPLSTAFMLCTLVLVIFGSVPFVGEACVFTVRALCSLIQSIVGTLSKPDFATVSLRYPFATVLVVLFAISFFVLLIVRLKRKWLILVPALSFAVLFSVCVVAVNISKPQEMTYYKSDTQGVMAISSRGHLALVDMSGGSYYWYSQALQNAAENGAVTVDKIVFTKITKTHISSMDYFLRSNIIREIYIPVPQNDEQRQNALLLAALADECGTDSYLYIGTDVMELDGIEFVADVLYEENKTYTSVFVSSGEEMFGYTDALIFDGENDVRLNSILSKCDTLLIGSKEEISAPYLPNVSSSTKVVYLSEQVYKYSRRAGKSYCNTKENTVLIFPFK